MGSFAAEDATAEMEYASPVATAKNDETDQPLDVAGSKVKFTLKKHDFIIIRATMK